MVKKIFENLIINLSRIKNHLHTRLLSPSFYAVGKKCSIMPPLRFSNLSAIELNDYVTIHSNCWIQAIIEEETCGNCPKLIMKDHVCIGMNSTISAASRIVIEDHVFTARNVYISDHRHAYENIELPISSQGIDSIAEVIIGAHTWLGQNAVVLPGVKIGKHCIIGANSVVNKSIPDYSVAAGVPARVVKKYDFESKRWVAVTLDE